VDRNSNVQGHLSRSWDDDRHGVLRYAGQTHPLKADQRRDVAASLQTMVFQGAPPPTAS
jgi:hypothetical protein